MTVSRWIVAAVVVAVVSLVVAEIAARTLFGLRTLVIQVPYHPIFTFGEFDNLSTNVQMARGPSGPGSFGYESGLIGYYYTGASPPPRSSTSLSDFLFRHSLSRYDSAEVDRINCEQPNAATVYVLGGSVAQGHSSRTREGTWHAILEKMLRNRLQRNDVYLFNAAMGGFLSLQDKLAYYLAVVPRNGRAVLFINSQNDLVVPAASATRPGDPYVLGVRFGQFFSDGFLWWLAKHSAIANALIQNELGAAVAAYRKRLNEDAAAFREYAEAVTDIYVENMGEILADCRVHGRACLVAIQPSRTISAFNTGAEAKDVLSERRMRMLYEMLMAKVDTSPYRADFVDLTHIFDSPDLASFYTDAAHISERGQEILAAALLAPALDLLRTASAGKPNCRRQEGWQMSGDAR